jgi:hypothetical protein
MSKINELSMVVSELKRCGDALIGLSESLAGLFNGSDDTQSNVDPTPDSSVPQNKPISLEMVRSVLAEKSRAGYTANVRALLEKHGAAKLSEIKPEEYAALLTEAEVLGNG